MNNRTHPALIVPDIREFPTAVIASISTGVLMCNFGDMHEAAEFLMGHSIWTHHFASKDLSQKMKEKVVAQCPGMPTQIDGVTKENWRQKLAEIETKIGSTVKIHRGAGETAMSPLDGIPDHLKDHTIVVDTDA